jgi:transposase-like protein
LKKRRIKCKYCDSLSTYRNGKRKIKTGFVEKFYCRKCKGYFTLRINPHSRMGLREKVNLTRTHLEGRTPIRTIARHTGHSTKTVCNSIQEITSQCVSAAWIAINLKPQWSGYLALDGKMIRVWDWAAKHFRYTKKERRWLHKMSLLVALDLGTLDIPDHHLGDEETAIDLILFLQSLKGLGYPLKGYISDGNKDIERAINRVFGKVPHQLCIRHYMQNLKDKLGEGKIAEFEYSDACQSLQQGVKPKYLKVPSDLFTFRTIRQLPPTNQQIENLNRYFMLRLKTIGQFQSFPSAKCYCNALTLMRRFVAFTDCRDKAKNNKPPLELAGCNVKELDYLSLRKFRR